MDDLLKSAATKIPELVVLFLIIKSFLSYLVSRDELIRMMHNEHLDARAQSRETLRDNILATRENTQAVQSLRAVVDTLVGKGSRT